MPRKNLILISVDTLRADVAYSGLFTGLNSLREKGASFSTVVSSSPLTPVSHATVFSGLQPPGHGLRHLLREQINPGTCMLAEVLKAEGFRTGAVVSCPGMSAWYGFDRGFDHYDDWVPLLADGRDASTIADVELRGTALKRAEMVTDRALAWTEEAAETPQFLFAHYFDSHWPYEPPDTYGTQVANPYEGEVAYADHHLENLISGLAGRGFNQSNTLFVLFSDHGEDLAGWYPNDHANMDEFRFERGHGCLLFDATQLVPLILVSDGIAAGIEVTDQVRLVDLLPTILDLLGIPMPARLDGRSVVPLMSGQPMETIGAYCETYYPEELAEQDPFWRDLRALNAVRHPNTKVIWETPDGDVDIYDLDLDPNEIVRLGSHKRDRSV